MIIQPPHGRNSLRCPFCPSIFRQMDTTQGGWARSLTTFMKIPSVGTILKQFLSCRRKHKLCSLSFGRMVRRNRINAIEYIPLYSAESSRIHSETVHLREETRPFLLPGSRTSFSGSSPRIIYTPAKVMPTTNQIIRRRCEWWNSSKNTRTIHFSLEPAFIVRISPGSRQEVL